MSNLAPQKINLSYSGLLQVPGGLTSSLQYITDGNGVSSGLQISTTGFSGTIVSDTVTITGGTINGTAIGATNPSSGRFSSLTVSTLTGLLKGSSGAVSTATANTDYLTPPSGTAILKANSGGALANATSGVDYAPATSGTDILKGNGSGGFSAAVANTDYQGVITATGLLKGAGAGSISAAVVGTDYAPATTGTSILKGSGTGGFSDAVSGTDYAPATSGTSILKGNNAGGFSAAVAGTDYAGLASANTFTNNQVISVNSSSDALRITQTGAGNALVVEDSANPDSTPFVVDSNGNLIKGYTSSILYSSGTTPALQLNAAGTMQYGISRFSGNSLGNAFVFLKSRGTTIDSHVVVQSGDALGTVGWYGSDGTEGIYAASIQAAVDGTPGTNDMPGRLVFSTTKDGASSPTEALRIKNTQESWFQANNSTSAVTITQTGAGNALVVEDSANPDSTPFVINQEGTVIAGATQSYLTGLGTVGRISAINAVADTGQGLQVIKYRATASLGADIELAKSASSTIGTNTTVASGDSIGTIWFTAADGTGFVKAASIASSVDGTPGVNDMPGRLVFSTTADGASSPTERMRIDNAGRVGIGGSAGGSTTLRVTKTVTGGTTAYGLNNDGVIQSDVTTQASYFRTAVSTQDAAFSLASLVHYEAAQSTINGGSRTAPTSQYGFWARNSLTGATNNYGFYSDIASGTGRYNFYAAGSASNYLGGDLTFQPLASATPANNGDLTFEATSNTSVKIKLKGSDGVVRSVTLTLA